MSSQDPVKKGDKERAATLIQSFWRGYQNRKKYGIKHLSESDLTSCDTFVVGNDPKIKNLAPFSSEHEKVALIGTSGLRSLALICELGNAENVPKLITVDNSIKVIKFWRGLRDLVQEGDYSCPLEFIAKFKEFLFLNKGLYRDLPRDCCTSSNRGTTEYEIQDPVLFIDTLFYKYGLDYVTAIIKSSVVIGQSWADKSLFCSLKNIVDLMGIEKTYIYPSNIPHCISHSEIDSVFENIQTMSPTLSIITDCCPYHHMPENVILSTKQGASDIKKQVFPQSSSSSSRSYSSVGESVIVISDPRDLVLLSALFNSFGGSSFTINLLDI